MFDNKQQRMLGLLEDLIFSCTKCDLYKNGRCKVYWTPISEYVIIGEAPGAKEVEFNEPFYGPAGNYLWEIMNDFKFRKEQFAIINSVNCRPMDGNRNGKPTDAQKTSCYPWLRKFISVIDPSKILLLGNHATSSVLGFSSGIMGRNGDLYSRNFNHKVYGVITSVHPSMCIYRKEEGKELLKRAIRRFKEYHV